MGRLLTCMLLFAVSACRTGASLSPEAARTEARALAARGESADAYELLESAWKKRPEDLALARELASLSAPAGQVQRLLRLLDSPGLAPDYVQAYVRGLVRFGRTAEATEALGELRRAVDLRPDVAELHHRLGRALVETEAFAAAVPALRQAVTLAPSVTGAYLPLAKALARTGHRPEAVEILRTWLHHRPPAEEVPLGIALMDEIADPFAGVPPAASQKIEQALFWLEQRDVPQEALRYFEEILAEYPDLSIVHALSGLCHQRLDDAGRALEAFRKAIELSPEQGKYHQYVGELYASRQRLVPAREALERAVKLHPLLPSAYARLGQLAFQGRDLPAARDALRNWVLLSPGQPAPKLELALVHQLSGAYSEAESLLLSVARDHPESLEAQLRLGLLYVEMHQKATGTERTRTAQAARERLEVVLQKQPHNAVASRALQSLAKSRP